MIAWIALIIAALALLIAVAPYLIDALFPTNNWG